MPKLDSTEEEERASAQPTWQEQHQEPGGMKRTRRPLIKKVLGTLAAAVVVGVLAAAWGTLEAAGPVQAQTADPT